MSASTSWTCDARFSIAAVTYSTGIVEIGGVVNSERTSRSLRAE
ncbi:MAG: hypothetical protein WCA29_11060 [Jiangellales bacterium]